MDASRLSGTEPLTDPGRIDTARLAAFLRANLAGCDGEATVARFRGGQSNPTLLLTFEGGRKLVLRKKPDGTLLRSAHAVDREFRVLKALEGSGVPVPAVHLLCDDDSLAGAMFYVMDHVEGRGFWDPALPDLKPGERSAAYAEMGRVIAVLHRLDPATLGLGDFGRPGHYIARQVARWTKQYRASETEPIAAMDRLIAWLPENLPPERPATLIHGDFRIDNMIFRQGEPRIAAVLDWELSTLGDPVADFAYHMLSWHFPPKPFRGLTGLNLAELGIPGEAEHRAAYFAAIGQPEPDAREWNVYLAFCLFRVAAIRQGIMRRVVDGTASSRYAREAGALARSVAEMALTFAEKA